MTQDLSGPFKPVPKCDPPVDPTPTTFNPVAPAEAPAPSAPALPEPILFVSPERMATCAQWPAYTSGEPPSGSDVIIPAGTFQEALVIQNLNIPRQDLYFIAEVLATHYSEVVDLIEAYDVAGLAAFLNVSQSTATLLITESASIRARLVEQAEFAAIAGLSCWWSNDEYTAHCPAGASTLLGTNPSVVLAGQYTSQVSKDDANDQARAYAEAGLVCFYESDEQVLVCSDLDPSKSDLDPESTSQSAGSSAHADPTRYFQNQTIVEAGAFVSELSKEDANLQARAYGWTQLDCFYIQPAPVTEICDPDEDAIPAKLRPVYYDGSSTGNPVTVRAGYTLSEASFADTLQQASDLAVSALECQWGNQRMRYSCDDAESDTTIYAEILSHTQNYFTACAMAQKEPPTIYMNAFAGNVQFFAIPSKSAVYSVLVPKDEFLSSIGTRDANTLAAVYAVSQLSCTYCNPEIHSVCPTPSAGDAFASNYTIRVPGLAYVQDVDELWKPFADVCTLPSNTVATFCGLDPWNVAAQADSLGSRAYKDIITVDTECLYDNRDVYVACQEETVVVAPAHWSDINPETGLLYSVDTVKDWKINAGAPDLGVGHTTGWIFIPHGTFTASTQEEADNLAVAMGLSQLDCYWDNDERVKSCDESESSMMLGGQLHTSYTVPAHIFQSYLSKEEANHQADLLAESMLTCLYCSDMVSTTTCPYVTLPACTSVSGVSTGDATSTAEGVLDAIVSVIQDCGSGSGSGGSGGSAGGGGGGGGGSSGSGGTGSGKSTAIVPATWEDTGYTALFIHEMPEVRFDDVLQFPVLQPVTRIALDFKFVEVCEPHSIVVDSAVGDTNPVRCARVEGDTLVVEASPDALPERVTVRVTGVRKGFAGMRFPSRTREQFLANEAFINSAYPDE